jgi:hypothetical protein
VIAPVEATAVDFPCMQKGLERTAPDEAPPIDPDAIEDAYRYHRARRRARVEHHRSLRRAGLRFWVVLLLLVVASVALVVTVWGQVQQLFGL